ncbi:hypothetical protein BZG36_05621, partial [Bifiguratus adelaidae]
MPHIPSRRRSPSYHDMDVESPIVGPFSAETSNPLDGISLTENNSVYGGETHYAPVTGALGSPHGKRKFGHWVAGDGGMTYGQEWRGKMMRMDTTGDGEHSDGQIPYLIRRMPIRNSGRFSHNKHKHATSDKRLASASSPHGHTNINSRFASALRLRDRDSSDEEDMDHDVAMLPSSSPRRHNRLQRRVSPQYIHLPDACRMFQSHNANGTASAPPILMAKSPRWANTKNQNKIDNNHAPLGSDRFSTGEEYYTSAPYISPKPAQCAICSRQRVLNVANYAECVACDRTICALCTRICYGRNNRGCVLLPMVAAQKRAKGIRAGGVVICQECSAE